jgi:hypothetical protein
LTDDWYLLQSLYRDRRSFMEQRLSFARLVGTAAQRNSGRLFCLSLGDESLCAGDKSR